MLAERAQDAHAQAPEPPATPAIPAFPAPDLPPPSAPPASVPPSVPALPSVPVPVLPPAPNIPPAMPLPLPSRPAAPAVPPATGPDVPGVPPAALPDAPAAPDVPGVDPGLVTDAVGPLPDVPEVEPPEPSLPDLPELPELPDPVVPLDGVLDLGSAPVPQAPAPADTPDGAPSTPVADPAPTRARFTGTDIALGGFDVGFVLARAPPTEEPGSPHPCPGGGFTHPTRADPAAFLSPGADAASRRAGLLAEARAYASALIRDPLLRPD